MQRTTLAVRLLVGAFFIITGALKIGHFNDLAAAIAGFRILPEAAVGPLAVFIPLLEVGVGLYLLLGWFARAAAAVASGMLVLYSAAIASAVVRHIPANCGCFGPQDKAVADWPHVAADLALAAVCGLVAWRST